MDMYGGFGDGLLLALPQRILLSWGHPKCDHIWP